MPLLSGHRQTHPHRHAPVQLLQWHWPFSGRYAVTDARPNTPVPDELNAVRLEIKRLAERESELKRLLITDPELREGKDWLAEIRVTHEARTDIKEMRACHPDLVAEFTFPREKTSVVLVGLSSDGELIPAKRFRKDAVQS